MSGKGVSTLQTDQLNVIAHHLNEINKQEILWPKNRTSWPLQMNSPLLIEKQIQTNKLRRKSLIHTPQWDCFLKSEWNQLNQYKKADMFGDPVLRETL